MAWTFLGGGESKFTDPETVSFFKMWNTEPNRYIFYGHILTQFWICNVRRLLLNDSFFLINGEQIVSKRSSVHQDGFCCVDFFFFFFFWLGFADFSLLALQSGFVLLPRGVLLFFPQGMSPSVFSPCFPIRFPVALQNSISLTKCCRWFHSRNLLCAGVAYQAVMQLCLFSIWCDLDGPSL